MDQYFNPGSTQKEGWKMPNGCYLMRGLLYLIYGSDKLFDDMVALELGRLLCQGKEKEKVWKLLFYAFVGPFVG